MAKMSERLEIFFNDEEVGELSYDAERERFTVWYDARWKEKGFAISPHIPLNGPVRSEAVGIFLRNLLPEGEALGELAQYVRVSRESTFALLRHIGLDVAGALSFGSLSRMQADAFRVIGEKELADRIARRGSESIAVWDGKMRLSVAGVQEKLPVTIRNGVVGLGGGRVASTHLLKFERERDRHVVLNEFYCMRLAKKLGLDAAHVELKRYGNHSALLVERFDRRVRGDAVSRIHIIDGCQMLGVPPGMKYERNLGSGREVRHIRSGVSFPKLFEAARTCKVAARAQLALLEWALYNLLLSNADAHGKNFSFFVDREGIEPAPMYDLLSIAMHPQYHQELAMAFGDEFDPDGVKGYALRDFAETVGLKPKLVSRQALKLCRGVRKALPFEPGVALDEVERRFIAGLEALIVKRAAVLEEAAEEMLLVSY
jgi:serine/threonine-protein kinase HipA